MKRTPLLCWLVGATSGLLVPALALAEEGHGGEHGGDHHAPHIANWLNPIGETNKHAPAFVWVLFTFSVFAFLLYRFAGPQMRTYLQTRHDDIKRAIEEARVAKEEAEAKKREYEDRLRALDEEVAALKKDFEDRGKAELSRLEEAGKRAAERIKKDAEDTIAAEMERAQEGLKAEAAKLALELAEQTIKKAITDQDEKRLRESFLSQLAS